MRFRLARAALTGALLVGTLAACTTGGDARIGRAADPGAPGGRDLSALLVPYPAGAVPWKKSRTGVMTLDQFLGTFYTSKNRAATRALLVDRGFVVAVRHGWFNADGTQEDVWLVRFSSAKGAAGEYRGVTDSWKAAAKPTATFPVPAVHGCGESVPVADSLGNTTAKAAASRGAVFLYARVFTREQPDRGRVTRLVREQYDALSG